VNDAQKALIFMAVVFVLGWAFGALSMAAVL
jgi:hypothetical protein